MLALGTAEKARALREENQIRLIWLFRQICELMGIVVEEAIK